jgi:catechol 2,3-dioxygenase-like lactoylglutathione lyase family enzyme
LSTASDGDIIPGMAPFTGWIVVAVRDVDAAAAWYKQKLELPESRTIEDEETGGLELSTRNLEIKVLLFAGADYPDRPILDTRNAAKAREWLLARGVEVGPVETDIQGTHYIEMRDLEGNSIEICEEPG